MSLPILPEGTQDSGSYTSSSLVVWQGPDLPCITLCKGDTISDITAKLAQKLCDLLDQTDITTFDIPENCFPCPDPQTFHDLIQAILDKLCACCDSSVTPSPTPPVCPDDCIIDIASCFYYKNQFGDTITQMSLKDYAKAIGVQVCAILNSISVINTTLIQDRTDIDFLLNNACLQPCVGSSGGSAFADSSNFFTTCLTDKIPVIPSGGILLPDLVTAIESAFCELRAATGMPGDILNAIFKQCTNLDISPTLNLPGVNMGSLPGWVLQSNYSTLADSVNNMWLTICDLRAAVTTIMKTCCPQGCDDLVISLQTVFTAPSTLTFFWTGNTTGFQDCNPAGSLITITDAYGNTYTTRIPIVAYINSSYALNLSGTPLNTATNLSIHIDACFNNLSLSTTCERCIETVVVNTTPCPALILTADSSSIVYTFNSTVTGPVTYTIRVNKYSDNSLIDSQVVVTSTPGLITGTFSSGILPGTTYLITITVTIAGVITNTCPVGVIVTSDLLCNPPVEVSATPSLIP